MSVKLITFAKMLLICVMILTITLLYFRWYSKTVLSVGIKPTVDSTASTLDKELSQKLYKVIEEARKQLDVPSLQVSVIIKGKGKWNGSVGWADPKAKRAATIHDLYHIGSVSKLYTSAVIMKLVQDGKLSLDDPLSKYITGYPNSHKITIRNLLNHTSGLFNYTDDLSFLFRTVIFKKTWTVDEIIEVSKKHKPYFEPGMQYYYSNTNYILLGKIAEQVTGQTFSTLLKENFLIPLGLNNTFFAPEKNLPEKVVRGYDITLLGFGKLGIKKDIESLRLPFETGSFTAGGIVANSADVSQFTFNLFEGAILNEKTKLMMASFIDAPDEDVPEQTGYGLGLRRLVIGKEELRGHTGVFPGFSNVSVYSPEKSYVITVLSNLSVAQTNDVIKKIQNEIIEKL